MTTITVPFTHKALAPVTTEDGGVDVQVVLSRVQCGVDFLDAILPHWRTLIDPDSLNLSDTCRCVRGQLAGRMFDPKDTREAKVVAAAIEAYNEPLSFYNNEQSNRHVTEYPIGLGMEAKSHYEDSSNTDEEYEILAEGWRRAIRGQDVFAV